MPGSADLAIGARSRQARGHVRQIGACRQDEARVAFQQARWQLAEWCKRPGRDDRIDTVILDRNGFRRSFDEFHAYLWARRPTGHRHELRGRLDRQDLLNDRPVERQVQARTDSDLDDLTFGSTDHPFAIRDETLVAHREIAEPWQDDAVVEAHRTISFGADLAVWAGLTFGLAH